MLSLVADGNEHEVELTAGPLTGSVLDINGATTSRPEKLNAEIVKQRRLAN